MALNPVYLQLSCDDALPSDALKLSQYFL